MPGTWGGQDPSGKESDKGNSENINNFPLEHVYPAGSNVVNEEDEEEMHADNRLTSLNRNYILLILCYQVPFTFFNLFFAISSPYSLCMDSSQGISILVLRPWLFIVGFSECALVIALLTPIIFFRGDCISFDTLVGVWGVVGIVTFLKMLVWAIVELELFARVIVHYCSGGVFVYGLILAIFHTILLIGVCCCSGTRSGAYF